MHFRNGACVENRTESEVIARFRVGNNVVYEAALAPGEWGRPSQRYIRDWQIDCEAADASWRYSRGFDLTDQDVLVRIDSRTLGDTLAWLPQIARFAREHHQTAVHVSHYLGGLDFQSVYPELRFVPPDTDEKSYYAVFKIGLHFDETARKHHPVDPRSRPLAQVAADMLGIPYVEERTRMPFTPGRRPIEEAYVVIATQSTAGAKLWQRQDGWQGVVDELGRRGLRVAVIQKESHSLKNVIDLSGDRPLAERMNQIFHAQYFIGLPSGLSWLAWAMRKAVVMISGFSEDFAEFRFDQYRVTNRSVCHGCWNDKSEAFDRNDWNWCPRHHGSERQFECTRSITVEDVLGVVDGLHQERFPDMSFSHTGAGMR